MAFKKTNGPVQVSGIAVTVDGNFEKALRQFTKKVQNSGKLKLAKEKEHFVSNVEKKKVAKKRAIKRNLKKQLNSNSSLTKKSK